MYTSMDVTFLKKYINIIQITNTNPKRYYVLHTHSCIIILEKFLSSSSGAGSSTIKIMLNLH